MAGHPHPIIEKYKRTTNPKRFSVSHHCSLFSILCYLIIYSLYTTFPVIQLVRYNLGTRFDTAHSTS